MFLSSHTDPFFAENQRLKMAWNRLPTAAVTRRQAPAPRFYGFQAPSRKAVAAARPFLMASAAPRFVYTKLAPVSLQQQQQAALRNVFKAPVVRQAPMAARPPVKAAPVIKPKAPINPVHESDGPCLF